MFNRYSKTGRLAVLLALTLASATTHLAGQTKSLDRQYDPIVFDAIEASDALLGLPIAELTAYKFNASSGAFDAIRFQIDEVSPDGKYLVENKGTIDENDEIVFMPGDAGDRATTDQWLNDAGARQNPRIEIEVEDPLAPGKKGWIYLYRKVSNPPVNLPPYVSFASGLAGADTIKAVSYVAANATNGLPNFQSIRNSNGQLSPNLVDRLKLRLKGSALNFFPYEVRETDTYFKFVALKYGGGPVRGLRQLDVSLGVPEIALLPNPIDTVSFITECFPFSNSLNAKDAKIDSEYVALAGAKLLRQSLDLNANVVGANMRFYNAANTAGFLIDGVLSSAEATPAPNLLDAQTNWFLAKGDLGALAVLEIVPAIGDTRKLYYYDNAGGGTADGSTDTGDGKSYGDFGIQINATTQLSGTLSFDFNLTTYGLDPTALILNDPVAAGTQFKAWQDNRVKVLAVAQFMTAVAESPDGNTPEVFALHEAYPNPFAGAREQTRIIFNLGLERGEPQVSIYNLVGQEVARFTTAQGLRAGKGRQELLWNGRDRNGRLLPPGVYFYRLRAGAQVATKKLILVR